MSYVIQHKVNYRNDKTGKIHKLVGLFTENGVIASHLRYLASKSNKSETWKLKSVDSIKLLIEYLIANDSRLDDSRFDKITYLLQSFTGALTTGTIDYISMYDPSGLYWAPREIINSNEILSHITQYTDYLALQEGYSEKRFDSYRNSNSFEEKLNWCAYCNKQYHVFLNHLSGSLDEKRAAERVSYHQRIVTGKAPKNENRDRKKFADDKLG